MSNISLNDQFAGIYDFKQTDYGERIGLRMQKTTYWLCAIQRIKWSRSDSTCPNTRIWILDQFQLDCQQYGIQLTRLGNEHKTIFILRCSSL